jgi:hypothetical protein
MTAWYPRYGWKCAKDPSPPQYAERTRHGGGPHSYLRGCCPPTSQRSDDFLRERTTCDPIPHNRLRATEGSRPGGAGARPGHGTRPVVLLARSFSRRQGAVYKRVTGRRLPQEVNPVGRFGNTRSGGCSAGRRICGISRLCGLPGRCPGRGSARGEKDSSVAPTAPAAFPIARGGRFLRMTGFASGLVTACPFTRSPVHPFTPSRPHRFGSGCGAGSGDFVGSPISSFIRRAPSLGTMPAPLRMAHACVNSAPSSTIMDE